MRQAYGHKARSGKDTAVNYKMEKYGGEVIRFADPVYEISEFIQKRLGRDIKKEPKLLQFIGEGLKGVFNDEEIWAKEAERKIKNIQEDKNIYVPDLRFKCEYQMLKNNGFTCIKINRKDRPIDRDPTHKSEVDLDDVEFDKDINNDGTLEEFYERIDYN